MADVYITLDRLEQVVTDLEAIISEFDNATSLSEELEAAISDPFGENKLKDEAQEFEERWDDKRDQLKDGLTGVKDHVKGILDGIEEWDAETAKAFNGQ
jgi:predicted  nucleic acid-binding Zn-ribbon protein